MQIIIASHNIHKIREFRDIFKAFRFKNIDLLSLLHFPNYSPPEETGGTFLENSQIKARHAAKHLKGWVLADDSGLVVPALSGLPGVMSRRYAGEDATDAENRQKLLLSMERLSDMHRAAYFECSLTLCGPDNYEKSFSGISEGMITEKELGRNGFGYDPIFLKHDYDKTFAELDEQTKNRVSHRRKAFEKLAVALETILPLS